MGRHPRSRKAGSGGSATLVFAIGGLLRSHSLGGAARRLPWCGRSLMICLLKLSLNRSWCRLKNLRPAFAFSSWPSAFSFAAWLSPRCLRSREGLHLKEHLS